MTFTAKAHIRESVKYSKFHLTLIHSDERENYALRHLYSLENTKTILTNLGWSKDEIKEATEYITIDVREKSVRLHVPGWIPVSDRQAKQYSVMDGTAKIINSQLCKKIRGISRFISKDVYVHILIERCWKKADPYKLLPREGQWDEFIAQGMDENYQLTLHPHGITCTCHAFSGISKAFNQDAWATYYLQENPFAQGQIPDKHIFAIWKYLGAHTLNEYEQCYRNRQSVWMAEHFEQEPDSIQYLGLPDEDEIAAY